MSRGFRVLGGGVGVEQDAVLANNGRI